MLGETLKVYWDASRTGHVFSTPLLCRRESPAFPLDLESATALWSTPHHGMRSAPSAGFWERGDITGPYRAEFPELADFDADEYRIVSLVTRGDDQVAIRREIGCAMVMLADLGFLDGTADVNPQPPKAPGWDRSVGLAVDCERLVAALRGGEAKAIGEAGWSELTAPCAAWSLALMNGLASLSGMTAGYPYPAGTSADFSQAVLHKVVTLCDAVREAAIERVDGQHAGGSSRIQRESISLSFDLLRRSLRSGGEFFPLSVSVRSSMGLAAEAMPDNEVLPLVAAVIEHGLLLSIRLRSGTA